MSVISSHAVPPTMPIVAALAAQPCRRDVPVQGYRDTALDHRCSPGSIFPAPAVIDPDNVTTEPLVSFDHVTKVFHYGHERSNARAAIPGRWGEPRGRHAFRALDDVSFDVAPGEAFGIVGPNGAGKSTILKILAGAVVPTAGTVRRPIRTVSIVELGLGFDADLTGAENIDYGGALLGLTPEQIDARRDEIIDFAELEDFATMPVKRYSTGMLARLGFALATSVDADLFVIDEVLSVGDWGFQAKSLDRMRERHRAGAAVVFVSHNLWIVNQLCERALLIDSGQVKAHGPTPEVLGAYLGKSQYTLRHGGVDEDRSATDADADADETLALDSPPVGAAPATTRPLTDDHTWRPVSITSLVAEPDEIRPGGEMTLRATVVVRVPSPELQLLASMYWEGYATFAIPDRLPSEFLSEPGVYELDVHYSMVPASPSTSTWQLAVVRTDETDEDPEQLLPGAIDRVTTTLRITGPVTPRPGIFLPHSSSVRRVRPEED